MQNVCALLDSLGTAVKAMPLRPLAIPTHVAVTLINIFNVTISLMDFIYVPVKQDGQGVTVMKKLTHVILILVKTQEHAPRVEAAIPAVVVASTPETSVKVSY